MKIKSWCTPPVLIVMEITIERLIGTLILDKTSIESKSTDPIQKIFGSISDNFKKSQNISSNCLFEFRNGLNMPNIAATLFKISNIDISGGIISNRSSLKSTQLNLSWFLIKLSERASKSWLNTNLIYPFTNSTSNLVLSTKVNKKIYDNIKIEEFKRTYPLQYKPDLSEEEKSIASDKEVEFIRKINNYIQRNAKYTWDILIKEMSTQIPVIITNVEKKIQEKTSQIEKISIEITEEN